MSSYELYISGKVQGVFFRASAQEQARQLNLTGYVENLPDGRVHALIQGDEQACQQFLDWCQDGPAQAEVSHLEARPISAPPYAQFIIQR